MEILFKNGTKKTIGLCTSCFYAVPSIRKISIEKGKQYVFYSETDFKGKSFFVDGGTHAPFVEKKELPFRTIQSIRIFVPEFKGAMLEPSQRDHMALQNAIDTWWSEDMQQHRDRILWWKNARFGCFVHWGVFSVCGGQYKWKTSGYTCHIERTAKISQKNYQKDFIEQFNPTQFDAEQWIQTAKNAGMEYFIITAKHHDGFCIYPSDAYPYDIRMTPFRDRDPLQELSDACRKHNMKFGFYYSHAYDWEHADAPGNDWEYENYGGTKNLYSRQGKGGWYNEHPEMVERTSKFYVDTKAIPQILELIRKYHPDILWFDTPHKLPLYDNIRILRAIREADPNIVINGRLARCDTFPTLCDYMNTGDRASHIFPTNGYWENIPTTNESYAYNKKDRSHKTPSYFIQLIAKAVARGGNVLMNIGPMGNGAIEDVDQEILQNIGTWFHKNEESIRNCDRNPLPMQSFGEVTRNQNALYLHVHRVPKSHKIILAGLLNTIEKAYVLEDEQQTLLAVQRLNYYDNEICLPDAFAHENVVLKVLVNGDVMSDGGRLLSTEEKETLLTFDADVIPLGCGHGDGKEKQNYVCGFQHTYQQLLWRIRLNETMKYKVKVHYKAVKGGGSYLLACGNQSTVRNLKKNLLGSIVEDSFVFEIAEGKNDLILQPNEIVGNFAQFFDITLEPMEHVTGDRCQLVIDREKIDLGDK